METFFKGFALLIAGVMFGVCMTLWVQRTPKKIVRVDAVTLKKADLLELASALESVNRSPSSGYLRFESDSGAVAFECPTAESCNLEAPARPRVWGKQIQVKLERVSR